MQKRQTHSKSRRGCKSCKQRHVKARETLIALCEISLAWTPKQRVGIADSLRSVMSRPLHAQAVLFERPLACIQVIWARKPTTQTSIHFLHDVPKKMRQNLPQNMRFRAPLLWLIQIYP